MDSLILVTGANKGIGLELCKLLATNAELPTDQFPAQQNFGDGACALGTPQTYSIICMAARDLYSLKAAMSKVSQVALPEKKLIGVILDLRNENSIAKAVMELKEYIHLLKAIVNNAALNLKNAWSEESFKELLLTNVIGSMKVTEAFLPYLVDGGRIVHVSSGIGRYSYASPTYQRLIKSIDTYEGLSKLPFIEDDASSSGYRMSYAITKMLLNRYTQLQVMDANLIKRNLKINAVSPGWCRTDMGGPGATRSAVSGAFSIYWLVQHPDPSPNGKFFVDGTEISYD